MRTKQIFYLFHFTSTFTNRYRVQVDTES